MDKSVIIAAIVAIVIIIGVTLIINPFGNSGTSTTPEKTADASISAEDVIKGTEEQPAPADTKKETTPEVKDTTPSKPKPDTSDGIPDKTAVDATYGVVIDEVEGDCTLYQHASTGRFECFGTAGEIETMVPRSEYNSVVEETEYFCKATKFGCKLYQKVILE